MNYVKSLTKECYAEAVISLKKRENADSAEIIAFAEKNRKQKRKELCKGRRKKCGNGVKGVGRRKNAVV